MEVAERLIITGGSNFGVRYDDQKILKPADFSFVAFANSDFHRKSEAAVIKEILVCDYGVESSRIFAETMSSTTEENAEILKILLRRRPAFTGNESIAILTLLYHMEKALPVFLKAGLVVEPLFVENILADNGQIDRVCEYYGTPKGGKQYPLNWMRRLLSNSESLSALMDL
ncbi:MAG: hypothetical protein A2528_00370 [Candidatus Staskawiczbacteria bacterium RIFOXYD2_FULL_37_9]|nr:MAG: hypothetical protein A2416_01100 [Candidatus Staskawiczbacteria bacterium RIFOXYC1_FULL_37_52]OGZ89075.1 MAG: hypothetical protein A2444_00795 [Candidatus Staskawiczbacteria bacterium RIFOXYC2_FULL_37_19]OGZ92774.1 MAG: hypothetical protein A2528_00370 [Candidatus Staskawiczbacteria bacterium RIFOXYD2_FULL_37_9]